MPHGNNMRLESLMVPICVPPSTSGCGEVPTAVFGSYTTRVIIRKVLDNAIEGSAPEEILGDICGALEKTKSIFLESGHCQQSQWNTAGLFRIFQRLHLWIKACPGPGGSKATISAGEKNCSRSAFEQERNWIAFAMANAIAREFMDGVDEATAKPLGKRIRDCMADFLGTCEAKEGFSEEEGSENVAVGPSEPVLRDLQMVLDHGFDSQEPVACSLKTIKGRILEALGAQVLPSAATRPEGQENVDEHLERDVSHREQCWIALCKRRLRSTNVARSTILLRSNLLLPWNLGNVLLVGPESSKNTIARVAATVLDRKCLTPEVVGFEDPTRAFHAALRNAIQIIRQQEEAVVLYLGEKFSNNDRVLSLIQNMFVSRRFASYSGGSEDQGFGVGGNILPSSPILQDGFQDRSECSHNKNMQMIERKLRIVVGMEEHRLRDISLSHPSILDSSTVQRLSPPTDQVLKSYCAESVAAYETVSMATLFSASSSEHRNASDKAILSKQLPSSSTVDEDSSGKEQEHLLGQPSESGERLLKYLSNSRKTKLSKELFGENMRKLVIEAVTALHQTSEKYLGKSQPLSKIDDILLVFGTIYSVCHKRLQHHRSQLKRSIDRLKSIREDIKETELRIQDGREQLKDLEAECTSLKEQLVVSERTILGSSNTLEAEQSKVGLKVTALDETRRDIEHAIITADERYEKAVADVLALADGDVNELKGYLSPPTLVQLVMEAICIIFDYQADWGNAKRLLNDNQITLKQRMNRYQVRSLQEGKAKRLLKIVQNPGFKPETVRLVCGAAESLCAWVLCVVQYFQKSKEVEKRSQHLNEQEEEVRSFQRSIRTRRRDLRAAKDHLDKLGKKNAQTLRVKRDVQHALRQDISQVEQSNAIAETLEAQRESWCAKVEELGCCLDRLFGNSILGAFCVVHWGALTESVRSELLGKWCEDASLMKLETTEPFNLCDFFKEGAGGAQDKYWPQTVIFDGRLKENLLITGLAPSVPLLIDPDMEAVTLIKSMDTSARWSVLSAEGGSVADDALSAIQNGNKVLLEIQDASTHSRALQDLLLHFQSCFHEPLMSHFGKTSATTPGWNIVDKSLFFFTRNPHFSGDAVTDELHTVVDFSLGKEALRMRMGSIVLRAVSSDVDMRVREVRGALELANLSIENNLDAIVSYISQAEGEVWNNKQLLNVLTNRIEGSESLRTDLDSLEKELDELVYATTCLAPIGRMLCYLHEAVELIAERSPSCEMSFSQFSLMFRSILRESLQDPDLHQSLKDSILGRLKKKMRHSASVQEDEPAPLPSNENHTLHSDSVGNITQLMQVLCRDLTLSICALWPNNYGETLKFLMMCWFEAESKGVSTEEIEFLRDLLVCNIGPPSWRSKDGGEREGSGCTSSIERISSQSLHLSDDFVRAVMSSGEDVLGSVQSWGTGDMDASVEDLKSVFWLEEHYPSSTFEGVSLSFRDKLTKFRWRSVALDVEAFDTESRLVPTEWRGRLCAFHLAILTHILAPHRFALTIRRLWNAVMGPEEELSTTKHLEHLLATTPASIPVVLHYTGRGCPISRLRKLEALSSVDQANKVEYQSPTSLVVLPASSLNTQKAEETVLHAMENGQWIALRDVLADVHVSLGVLKILASASKPARANFRLFFCVPSTELNDLPGCIRHSSLLFSTEDPKSIHLELIDALETLSCSTSDQVASRPFFEKKTNAPLHKSSSMGNLKASQDISITSRRRDHQLHATSSTAAAPGMLEDTSRATSMVLWRKISFGLVLAFSSSLHIYRRSSIALSGRTENDLVRGVHFIWNVLHERTARGRDLFGINIAELRASLSSIVFGYEGSGKEGQGELLLEKFIPDDICGNESFPWDIFNVPDQDSGYDSDSEELPEHPSLESYKWYVENHLLPGNRSLRDICSSQAHLLLAAHADESLSLWQIVARVWTSN
ncbi:hypothetical protein BSKO_09019 [Bryopsis sp. KO-2023]|nr:hypothetical protein BSKO_09019 [Bryopsis sp. KO-2023]